MFEIRREIFAHLWNAVLSWSEFAGQLWLAQLLRTSSGEYTVSLGRTTCGRVRFGCLFFFNVRGAMPGKCPVCRSIRECAWICRWVHLDATQLEPKSTALMITVGAGTQVRVDRCALCARGERVISRHSPRPEHLVLMVATALATPLKNAASTSQSRCDLPHMSTSACPGRTFRF